jgi:acetoin utilization deacetylase AcuC-like enzyme
MIGFVSSPRYVEHDTGPNHPERPDRIRAIHRAVREAGIVSSPDPFGQFELALGKVSGDGVKAIELEPYRADEEWVLTVHTEDHLRYVKRVIAAGGWVLDQGDTRVGESSFEVAMLSLGGVLRACDAVMSAERGIRRAFAAVRPPGHHAEPDRAMGFCLFSNVAIGARYLQRKHGIKRVAIVDFDVHHGNGTQAALEDDPSVYFVSMHETPRTLYPGSGFEWETGVGPGAGYTMNVPMDAGAGDDQYVAALRGKVIPTLVKFEPEVLMISAGFDGHVDDPLAHVELTEQGFERITRELVGLAERNCWGRVISVLEGGYNLRALGRSVVRHLVALGGGVMGL